MLETQWRFHNTHCLAAYTSLGLCLLVHMKSDVIAIGHVSAKPRIDEYLRKGLHQIYSHGCFY